MNSKRIVDRIIADLTDRIGLRQEWENIDDAVKEEIKTTWRDIIDEENVECWDCEFIESEGSGTTQKTEKETCANCRYYAKAIGDIGYCRRKAPTDITGKPPEYPFPYTVPGQWCGEWKAGKNEN